MNLTFLRYAVEVEKTGSISLAARNLYLGQPNVSKAIKELETTLGITIFKRTPRGVLPTPKGEEFLHYAKNILAQIDGLESMFREETSERISFRIAVPRASYILEAFADFAGELDAQKGMDMTFCELDTTDAIECVAQQECSLGVIRVDTAHEEYYQSLLGSKGLVSKPTILEMDKLILLNRSHPLAKELALDVKQLEEYPELIFGDRAAPFLSPADARTSAAQESRKKHIHVYSTGAAWELLRTVRGAYMWSSPVSERTLESFGCMQRSVRGAGAFKDLLIHPRDYRLRDIDRQFIAHLTRHKDAVAWHSYL